MTCQFTQFFVVLCMLYATSLVLTIIGEDVKRSKVEINAMNLTDGIKPEHLKVEVFDKAAVSSDIGQCSTVGKDILKRGGSAVDGAIATLLCLGTVQFPYSGIGGGGFMLVYSRKEKKTYGFDYRETVPANLNKKVFENRKKKKEYGGLAVAVPGEIKGFVSAWKKFGKLKWSELVQPSIDIAKEGFKVLEPPTEAGKDSMAKSDSNLRKLLLKQEEPEIIWKSVIKRPDYAKTLEKIRDAPNSMYEGELADIMVSDIKKKGGVMEKSDLKNYQVKMRKPITMKIKDLTLHTLPLPTGGPTVIHTLEICKNFKFSNEDFSTEEKTVLTYHRVLEAIKFANAFRPYFSDPDYPKNKTQLEELLKSILDPEMAKKHFKMIDDEKTHDITYYSKALNARDDHGTAHISVLAENGDAVSATSSLNLKYGAHFLSDTTGILYNDQLGDSYTVDSDEHKFTASEENLPKPFSRPLSAVAPNIIVDENGDVRMISGGAGGTKVPGSIAWIIMMKFWFGMDFGNSMMAGRLHHCLFPNEVKEYEVFPVKKFIHDGLKKKDHKITVGSERTVLQAIYREGKDGKIYSKTDPRRHTRAKTDGY